MISDKHKDDLIDAAIEGGKNAYIPYSKYRVGAAVMTSTNIIIKGCNIENSSHAASMCAERVAIFNSKSQNKEIIAVAIVTNNGGTPCGICRQVISELCPNAIIIVSTLDRSIYREYNIKDLLPDAFQLNAK
eukprot:GHVL01003312.1.p1 GENE.GHVL01003312.1~~GHVL01003312.1.p1  ORF type:complete len:132 (+),score=28.26 GHVL01003312.1:63-458(+)